MICSHCNKEINTYSESYELFGMDGDFIHTGCREGITKQMDKIANMSDDEFYNYVIGKDFSNG